ncbi:MAG: hypothetical protein AMJ46_08320 [Latescibacteria bacterium DG_63]|nr:MAG: hypothetical protein AMJ46_08320 [Latescibacteria bacterium DG_63]
MAQGIKPHLWTDQYQPSAMFGSVLALSGVDGVELAYHGPAGCYTIAGHIRTDQAPMGTYSAMRPSGITEDNLVMGTSMDKLRQLLKFIKLESEHTGRTPSLVAIVNADATAITGDDIAGMARQFEKETGVPSIALDTPGFKGWDVYGYDLAHKTLLAKFAKTDVPKKPNSVNLIAPYLMASQNWLFDLEGIKQLLAELGIEVNCVLARNITTKEIENFAAAEYNLFLTSEDFPMFNKETEKLGVPSFGADLPLSYGLVNTEEWLYAVAKKFGKLDEARKSLEKASERVRKVLRFNYSYTWQANLMMQKRPALIGRAQFVASLARSLYYDMDMFPELVALQAGTQEAADRAKKLLEPLIRDGLTLEIMVNPAYIEFARAVKRANIDFVLGSRIEKTLIEGMRIPHHTISSSYYFNTFRYVPVPYVGYDGILYLLQELGLAMEDMFHEKESWQGKVFKNI